MREGRIKAATPRLEVDGSIIPSGKEGKCLGYWWSGDLTAARAIEANIQKARRAFFLYGSILGRLEPSVDKICLETCVMPVLLGGCDNWVVIEGLLSKLEKCLAGMVKRGGGPIISLALQL